jgi:predicted alpha/beta-fold hydrolase
MKGIPLVLVTGNDCTRYDRYERVVCRPWCRYHQSLQRMNSQSWSIQKWCSQQEPSSWDALAHASSIEFLQRLNLPFVHPFCNPQTAPNPYEIPGVPGQGPLLNNDHLETYWDVLITIIAMGTPSLAAMAELWLRLFSSILAPLGVAILVYLDMFDNSASNQSSKNYDLFAMFICLITISSCVVLFTDSLYILEFGRSCGGTLLAVSFMLSWNICSKRQFHNARRVLIGMLLLVFILIYDVESDQFVFGSRLDEVKIEEGLYYDGKSCLSLIIIIIVILPSNIRQTFLFVCFETIRAETNKESVNIVNWWRVSNRTYSSVEGATPWLLTGDSRTGIPFLLNKVHAPKWTRVWLPLSDGEVLALDIAFPRKGYDTSQPVYLVLHGLTGGSQEGLVKDFASRRTENEGATVIVMVARGLMDLPIRGMNIFHGARWEDSRDAAIAVRRSMVSGQLIAGVGYSMGAIILSNMVARTGAECALDVAVAVSGGLDMRYEIDFPRAQRLWQPLLTVTLRDTFVVGKWGERVRHRLTKEEMKMLMRSTHVSEIDKTAVVVYNGFRDLEHYYSEMSALGDIPFPLKDHAGPFQPSLYRL